MAISRRAALLGGSALVLAGAGPPNTSNPLATRSAGARPLWQPVTNRNSTNGTQGTTGTTNPDTLGRTTKTVQVASSHFRTVLMGFQMNPFEQPLIGNNAGVTGAYACSGVSVGVGGTSYSVGDVLTFAKTAADMTALVLIVTRVASGAIAEVKIADPGAYAAPLADGASPATAVKRGNGATGGTVATFNFSWQEYAIAAQLGVEPAGTQTGANNQAVIPAGVGLRYDGLAVNSTLLVPDGGFLVTDPVRLALPAGAAYAERVATIGAPVGTQRTVMGVDYFANANTYRTGALASTALAAGTGNATMGTITLGIPNAPAPWVCAVGDSIDYGIVGSNGTAVDSGDSLQNSGWVERGLQLAGGFGLLSMARTGDALGSWYGSTNRRFMRLGMLAKLSEIVNFETCVFVCGLCINDVTAGTTSANIIAMMQWLMQDLLSFNPAGLFYSTAMPGGVSSTDSFATVTNQAVSSAFDSNRKAVNTWLRAGGGGMLAGKSGNTITGIIDRAAVVEAQNAAGNGVFLASATNDGTHPTQATHTTLLAPLVQSLFSGFTLPN